VAGTDAQAEVAAGERFAFGSNWQRFLELVDDDRIKIAEQSLRDKLGELRGRSFLDVGSGSGLFSLAARNLGARVHSFDFDEDSVRCTTELRRRYRPDDGDWTIERGSVLDRDFLARLGRFDVVYSWGVLHHTGDMWTALANVEPLVAPSGALMIAIYNDQGRASRGWRAVKRRYVRSRRLGRTALVGTVGFYFATRALLFRLPAIVAGFLRRRPVELSSTPQRGMDRYRDLVDWVGGYPFEVARPEEIFRFYRDRGFALTEMTTCAGNLGCNEYVLTRTATV
jgi:2-polyprenyl-3-methyl-5-hydroxy-6-metoxy-1,4-benzoquinol methylase